ncbi:helix-turn-helix domain-containing protein [Streptomyces sp. MSC1_001]|uniref:helix-turn-helix domain-containing protein n=1 Tax=Streptomyces sp. MSC1_001 TaxID=2909263 RepID=UPI0035B29E88
MRTARRTTAPPPRPTRTPPKAGPPERVGRAGLAARAACRTGPEPARTRRGEARQRRHDAARAESPRHPAASPLHQPGTQAPKSFDEVPAILRPATDTSAGRRQLRVLLGIAPYPTLRSACDALGLGRSTVTAQIRRLETTLGEPLLVRTKPPSPMKTTPFGDAIIAAVSPFPERLGSLRRSAGPGTHLST